jgi:hypothetical protein
VRGGASGEGGRAIRGPFTLLRVLSLVLLVATVAAWVRSYSAGDLIRVRGAVAAGGLVGHRVTDFWAAEGQVNVERVDTTMPAAPASADFAVFGAFSCRAHGRRARTHVWPARLWPSAVGVVSGGM